MHPRPFEFYHIKQPAGYQGRELDIKGRVYDLEPPSLELTQGWRGHLASHVSRYYNQGYATYQLELEIIFSLVHGRAAAARKNIYSDQREMNPTSNLEFIPRFVPLAS